MFVMPLFSNHETLLFYYYKNIFHSQINSIFIFYVILILLKKIEGNENYDKFNLKIEDELLYV